MTIQFNNSNQHANLTMASRVTRITISIVFMVAVLTASVSAAGLGLATRSVLSIYPTVIAAWDPMSALFGYIRHKAGQVNKTAEYHRQVV